MSQSNRPVELMWRTAGFATALVAVVLAAPVILALALLIWLESGAPVFFTQTRMGLAGEPFPLYKLRTLEREAAADRVTPEGDARVTRVGRWLRRYRLDEWPQLVDILLGHMAWIGPRPELEIDLSHVDPAALDRFLTIKPGLTGPVQTDFIAEDALLADCPDPTRVYREVLVPAKVAANLGAFAAATAWTRLGWVLCTPWVLVSRDARQRSRELVGKHLAGHLGGDA